MWKIEANIETSMMKKVKCKFERETRVNLDFFKCYNKFRSTDILNYEWIIVVCLIIIENLLNYVHVMSHICIYTCFILLHLCIMVHESFFAFSYLQTYPTDLQFMQFWGILVLLRNWANTSKLSTKTWESAKEQEIASFTISFH